MYKIGLSTKSNAFSDELFRSYKKASISTIEISNCSDGYDAIDFHAVKRMADEYGITLNSLHLPFKTHSGIPHDISAPELCRAAVEDHKKLIQIGTEIGIKVFVVHPSNEVLGDRTESMSICKRSLAELAEYADERGAVIAVENMTHQCLGNTIAEFEELVLSDPRLRVCFDTNHLLHESPGEFIRTFGKRIVTMHISDCNLEVEQHSMPGEGKVRFPEILEALGEVGYCGPWLYEVSYKCPRPENDKCGLTCESFVKNAMELFAGKRPIVKRDIRL